MRLSLTRTKIRTIQFDIVGGCRLKCVGRPNPTLPPKITRIDPAVFATCLTNINERRVHIFRLFNYGEPLLHDDLPSVFDALITAPRFEIDSVEISTNAQFVRWDQLEDVINPGKPPALPGDSQSLTFTAIERKPPIREPRRAQRRGG